MMMEKYSSKEYKKMCAHCLVEKPRNAFHANKRSRDGIGTYCKECRKKLKKSKWKPIKSKNKTVYEKRMTARTARAFSARQNLISHYGIDVVEVLDTLKDE